jgi:ribosomal protein S1
MLRAFLCTAALVGLATVSLAADKANNTANKKAKNGDEMHATVTKVDAAKNTLTVEWKDKEGKEETKTLTLTNDVKVADENGKTITLESLKAGDHVAITEHNGKVAEVERRKGHRHEATITKVDAKNGTVTVQWKGKNGKEEEKTFALTGESRYLDSTGREAAMDIFRSGNEVLVVEEQGKLVQMQQKGNKSGQNKANENKANPKK